MKKIILLIAFIIATHIAFAQAKVPAKGFWVVESNIHTPKKSIIRFYNDDQIIIYQEDITGRKINIKRLKIKQALNEVLSKAIKEKELIDKNSVMLALKR